MSLNIGAGADHGNVPVGAILPMAAPSVPTGYLECNGATVKRSDYSALFSLIGTTYGAGDSSTTFTLPDLRGEFIRGFDNGRGIDSGRGYGVFQDKDTSSGSHTHGYQRGTTGSATTDGGTLTLPLTNRPRNIAMYYIIKF
jgi:microcystin-dependent protein